MAWVTQQFLDTWKSGDHVGANAPHHVVYVRRSRYVRGYDPPFPGPPINVTIPGETAERPWWAHTQLYSDWIEVPNVASVEVVQDFEQNGMHVATIQLDNIMFSEQAGSLGQLYHLIERGYLAPYRGKHVDARPSADVATNEWQDVLTQMAEVRVWQGFGEPERWFDGRVTGTGGPNGAWTFNGLTDEDGFDSSPSGITIVARSGKPLTEQRVFGWNKSRTLRDPITFVDVDEAQIRTVEGYNARASSEMDSDHQASKVLDSDTDAEPTTWDSAGHGSPDVTEWVQIHVPRGRYEQIVVDAPPNMELYMGVYPRERAYTDSDTGKRYTEPATYGNVPIGAEAWHALVGTVPGSNGGWGYSKLYAATETPGGKHTYLFDDVYELGKGSVIRIGFRNLQEVGTIKDPVQPYIARVRQFIARKQATSEESRKQKWILTRDVSDMVRVALRWAGYTEWEIEDTGIPVPGRIKFNRSQFLIDIIKWAQDLTGFVFFIADPSNGESRGVPTFRRNSTLLRDPARKVAEISDRDLVTGLKVAVKEEPLAFNIRVRGKEAAKRDGGRTLGGDRVRRVMAVYRPPWTREDIGGVLKHFTLTKQHIRTVKGCWMMAYLVAVAEALAAVTATCEIPGNPNIELDDHVGLIDEGTGVNSRLWISSRTHTTTMGEEGAWRMTLQGSLIDNVFLQGVLADILADPQFQVPVAGINTVNEYILDDPRPDPYTGGRNELWTRLR